MEFVCVLAALAALFLLCAFLTLRTGLHAALAPLTALGLVVAWLTLTGMADGSASRHHFAVRRMLCAGCLGACAGQRDASGLRRLLTPGSVLFWGLSLAFALYFFLRQPMAATYDEFSLWATAVKVTKVDNRLYPTATLGTPWQSPKTRGLWC